MNDKFICAWYIKTFHPTFYFRTHFNFQIFSLGGKQELLRIKKESPYAIFDRCMVWAVQDEGYLYWLKESIKLTYLCFYINKNKKTYDFLLNLIDRSKTYPEDELIINIKNKISNE